MSHRFVELLLYLRRSSNIYSSSALHLFPGAIAFSEIIPLKLFYTILFIDYFSDNYAKVLSKSTLLYEVALNLIPYSTAVPVFSGNISMI